LRTRWQEIDSLEGVLLPPIYSIELVRKHRVGRRDLAWDTKAVATVLAKYLAVVDREHFVVVMVDARGYVIGVTTVAIGSLTRAEVTGREVFKPAVVANAAAIILAHNHPSGDPSPSPEDVAITQRLAVAGAVLDIPVLDHLVIGDGSFASFKALGLLPSPPENL
jgi:DNA repair protein RadC